MTTTYHPYILGCFGKGSNISGYYQQCSANPRLCGCTYSSSSSSTDAITSFGKIGALIAAVSTLALSGLYWLNQLNLMIKILFRIS